jgi:hypothetical protein
VTFPVSSEAGETAVAANSALSGKINSTGTVTLPNGGGTTTTVLTNYFLGPNSVVLFDPQTANAATEIYGATMYVLTANRGDGVWTITHAATAVPDRTFSYVILG